VGVNFGLIRLSLACLSSSPPLTLEAYFVLIYFCVLLLGILSCLGCLQHPWRTFDSKGFGKITSPLSYWFSSSCHKVTRTDSQGEPPPPAGDLVVGCGWPGPWSAAQFFQENLKWSYSTSPPSRHHKVLSCPHVLKQRSHGIPCNSHEYKYIYMHLYKKKTICTHMLYTWLFERMCPAKARLA
jgi:hypothetical protein